MQIACSYNPMFLNDASLIDVNVQLIELGMEAYNDLFAQKANYLSMVYQNNLSLHLARSPIVEKYTYQDSFIEEKLLPLTNDDRVISIGFHLSGSRYDNIGRLGFTSHYKASSMYEKNCIRFIEEVYNRIDKEVWLENANFYSKNIFEIIENWKSVSRILENSNAKLIVDISHLVIDCTNVGVSPDIFLGCICWDRVSEIHLSGIIEGRDGTLHDGHGEKVDIKSWLLFKQILDLNVLNDDVFVNIEHSELSWINKVDDYQDDFYQLKDMIGDYKKNFIISDKFDSAEKYAKSFLKKILISHVKNYTEICHTLNITEDELFDGWLKFVLDKYCKIALSKSEIDSMIKKDTIYFLDSFIEFVSLQYD